MLCTAKESCLLIIDIQERLINSMPQRVYNRVATRSALLIQIARLLDIPCIASLQYPQGLGPMDPTLEQLLAEDTVRINKTRFSCAGVEAFDQALTGTGSRQVCLVGMEAHICVLQTALDLKDKGYEVFVVEDAVCSNKREAYENTGTCLRQAGIRMPLAESVIFEWLRDAGHEHFKTISQLVKTQLHPAPEDGA